MGCPRRSCSRWPASTRWPTARSAAGSGAPTGCSAPPGSTRPTTCTRTGSSRPSRRKSVPSRPEVTVITPALLRQWPLPVPAGGKGDRGTALIVGGSRANPGGVLLAGVAALRAGAGVLQMAAAESTATALSVEVPEALVIGLPETDDGSVRGTVPDRLAELAGQAKAIAVGPG